MPTSKPKPRAMRPVRAWCVVDDRGRAWFMLCSSKRVALQHLATSTLHAPRIARVEVREVLPKKARKR